MECEVVEIKRDQMPEEAVRSHAPKEEDGMEAMTEEQEPGLEGEMESEEPGEDVADEEAGEVSEEALTEETAAETGEAPAQEKKRGFKKKQKKDKKDEKIEELNDRLMRNLAEFENFRNRSEKEKNAMFDMGAKTIVEKILPVVDNLERGFDGLSEEEKDSPFVKGIEAVYKQIQAVFEEIGVKAIEAVGQEFDPNFHNAVMHDEDDSGESSKVVEEFQKGYLYKDGVVRHSMVKVLN